LLTVPDHRDLETGLVRRLLRDAGMTVGALVDLRA